MENAKEPLWLNKLLLMATFLSLALVLFSAYRGWKEDRALHSSDQGGHSPIIADITFNLSGVPHQEHCLTCHPQGRSANLPGNIKPLKEHPDIRPHAIYELGCTGCHLGEGMARDLIISHGKMGMEARRVLAKQDLQAACYRCHELRPLRGAGKAWMGFQLFSANACDACHNVEGLAGGRYGPELSEIGSFLGLREIQKAIQDPKADPINSIMPKFSLSPEEIQAISYFLKSRMKESPFETPMVKRRRMKEEARQREKGATKVSGPGKAILQEKKCLACHRFEGEDGQIAPDLTHLGYMREERYLRNFLHTPGKEIPGAIMPWIPLSFEEEENILATLRKRGDTGHLRQMSPKHIYMTLCQRCHAARGDGAGNIQPNLANYPRAFWKNEDFFRRISDDRIRQSIEKGIPGTSMPPFGELLGKERVNSLVDLLFQEFIRMPRTEKRSELTLPSRPAKILSREKTEKEFARNCSSCHGVGGNGKGPEYLKYLPRPRDLTNQPYFNSLTDDRIARAIFYGIPGTAMAPFLKKISAESAWSLVDSIRELSRSRREGGKPIG